MDDHDNVSSSSSFSIVFHNSQTTGDGVKLTDLLTDEWKRLFEIVSFVAVCGVVALFGITANVINIIIFYKQGFNNTVNIAFFGLAISDFCCLFILLWVSLLMSPLFVTSKTNWIQPHVLYLSGSWPHICFCRITSFITVYITAERCLCITLPLKVKQIITPNKTTIILCAIYAINILSLIPEYTTAYLDWTFSSAMNKTIFGIIFSSSRKQIQGVIYILHFILGMTSFVSLLCFTVILVYKLSQTSKWRVKVTDQGKSMSKRDKNTGKMIVLIASILILCYTPGVIIALTSFVVGPEFDLMGRYHNICEAAWAIAFPIQAINSSVNIFLYYSMSSKYRETLHQIFGVLFNWCLKDHLF